MSRLFSGDRLQQKIEVELKDAKKIIFISAYITEPAIRWLSEKIRPVADVTVIGRLTPHDINCGSSDIAGMEQILSNSWGLRCLSNLHAKIYSIDDRVIFVGSANLTSNGLKLYGQGNLEACSEIPPDQENLDFIDQIKSSALSVDQKTLSKMKDFLDANPISLNSVDCPHWPADVLPENKDVWVTDFLWTVPDSLTENEDESVEHDLAMLQISTPISRESLSNALRQSKCFKWLIRKLENSKRDSIRFGELTQALHSDLKDDPSPYRRNVKQLLANLLAYCQEYAIDQITIGRPQHTQVVSLRSANEKPI